MIKKYVLIVFSIGFLFITKNASPFALENAHSSIMPNATISGDATVCQFNNEPVITFTGSNGTAPYTFTYTVNGGTPQMITSSGNIALLEVDTDTNGIFEYNLIEVEDATGAVNTASGSVTITITLGPDASLGGTGAGTFDGQSVFRICENETSSFTFTNTSSTNSINANYTIDWGDNTANFTATTWTTVMHDYDVGFYTLTYTIEGNNGCITQQEYIVFVGSNPAVSLGNPGNTDICNSEELTFPIFGTENNPPGTVYTITFNDGSAPINFNHPPPPDITHIFLVSSCDTTSSDGNNEFENSFSANIVATNPCGTSSVGVVPIYVSSEPQANFTYPIEPSCINTQVCFEDLSVGNSVSAVDTSCAEPIVIWEISPNTFTINSGNLGNDFGLDDPDLWLAGSEILCVNFNEAGTYTITQTVGGRCGIDEITQTICVEAPLIPQFNLSTTSGCSPLDVTTTNITDESASCQPTEYEWQVIYTSNFCGTTPEEWSFTNGTSATSTSPSFNFITPGTYTIQLEATNGCGGTTSSQEVIIKQPPTVIIDPLGIVCDSTSIIPSAIISTCTDDDSSVIYDWQFPGGTPSSSDMESPGTIDYGIAGTYTLSLQVTNDCGISEIITETFTIGEAPIITNTDLTQEICSGTSTTVINLMSSVTGTTFSWEATATAGISGFDASGSSDTIPAQVITTSNPSPGTVTYTVTPSIGDCVGSPVTFIITVNPAAQITTQPQSNTVCQNGTPITLDVATSEASPQYQWFSNTIDDVTTGTIITGETMNSYTPDISNLGTTYYYCIISFPSGGCSEITSDTAEIIVSEVPSISDFSETICSGNSFTISPDTSNGDIVPLSTNYTWTDPIISPAGSITGASAELTPQTNVSQTLVNTTTSPAIVTYTVTPVAVICIGEPFIVEVTVNPAISANEVITNGGCFGSNEGAITTNITGGVPFTTGMPYIISWIGPMGFISNDASISNLAPGDYTLTVQDNGGCPFSETYTITESTELILTIDTENSIECFGDDNGEIAVSVDGGTPNYSYNWTRNGLPFSMNEDISNLTAATYELTVSDSSSCNSIVQAFIITEPNELIVSLINQTDVGCFGETSGAIEIDITGGTPIEVLPGIFDYTYSWTGPNSFVSISQNVTGLEGGMYTVVVTDENGCEDTLSVTLDQPDEIIISVESTEIVCFGDDNATITITDITGGSGMYTIEWSNFGEGMVQTDLSAGEYTITVTDSNDCTASVAITIEQPPIFTIDPIVEQISCFGENDGRIILNFQGGQQPIEFSWDDDPNAGVERNNLGPGTYTITIVDAVPCTISETFAILEPAELALSSTIDNAFDCDDPNSGAINLLITGGTPPFTFNWSNGAITEDLNNTPPGDYIVTVVDNNGCEATGSYTIVRPSPIILNVETETDADCNSFIVSQNFMAQASGGVPPYTFSWSSGTVFGANNENMTTSQNGLVILQVTDDLGCLNSFTFEVEVPELSDADFDITSIAFETFGIYSQIDPIQFTNTTIGNFISISWDFGDGNFSNEENPVHSYVSPGVYTVIQTVIFPGGCEYRRIISLAIEEGYKLIMPSAFTPNGDGLNDFFRPVSIGLDSMELNIYTTWGELIYSETSDIIQGWNGEVKGEFTENGNYYYTFKGKTIFGKVVQQDGPFTLIL